MTNFQHRGSIHLAAAISLALGCAVWPAVGTAAGELPSIEAKFEPGNINMNKPDKEVTVVLSAATEDLRGCNISDVHLGTAVPVSLSPSRCSENGSLVQPGSPAGTTSMWPESR